MDDYVDVEKNSELNRFYMKNIIRYLMFLYVFTYIFQNFYINTVAETKKYMNLKEKKRWQSRREDNFVEIFWSITKRESFCKPRGGVLGPMAFISQSAITWLTSGRDRDAVKEFWWNSLFFKCRRATELNWEQATFTHTYVYECVCLYWEYFVLNIGADWQDTNWSKMERTGLWNIRSTVSFLYILSHNLHCCFMKKREMLIDRHDTVGMEFENHAKSQLREHQRLRAFITATEPAASIISLVWGQLLAPLFSRPIHLRPLRSLHRRRRPPVVGQATRSPARGHVPLLRPAQIRTIANRKPIIFLDLSSIMLIWIQVIHIRDIICIQMKN